MDLYAKTVLQEGKSIQKLNQEEEDKKSSMDDSNEDRGKAADEISRQVSLNKIQRPPTPMIEKVDRNPSPSHIEIVVPTNPEKKK